MNLPKNHVEQNVQGRRRINNVNNVENEREREMENNEMNRMNFATKGNNSALQWNLKSVHKNKRDNSNSSGITTMPNNTFLGNSAQENFKNQRNFTNNMLHEQINNDMTSYTQNSARIFTTYANTDRTSDDRSSGISGINRMDMVDERNGMGGMGVSGKLKEYLYPNEANPYFSNERNNFEMNTNAPSPYVSAHPILGKKKKEGNNINNTNFQQIDFRNNYELKDTSRSAMTNNNISNERKRLYNTSTSSHVLGEENNYEYSGFSTNGVVRPSQGKTGGVFGLYATVNTDNKSLREHNDLQFVNRVIGDEQRYKEEKEIELNERNSISRRHATDDMYREGRVEFLSGNRMNVTGKMDSPQKMSSPVNSGNIRNGSTGAIPTSSTNANASSGMHYPGFVKNVFDNLLGMTETKSEINNIVKEKVANIVMNEIEKKIDTADTSYLNKQLSHVRQYFDVTHSYVINKIFFIVMPYFHIYKALTESRTYYVYAHFKKKLEAVQTDKRLDSYVINQSVDLRMTSKILRNDKSANSFGWNMDNKNKNDVFHNSYTNNAMNNINENDSHTMNNNRNCDNSEYLRGVVRTNSNDIKYVDYSNIRLFKADLYIPLMSVITYILLYTLTVTAQKNNFIFNPDTLFNISSYIFLLILFETTLIKIMFLVVCRDINFSFFHILSFASYKFVIMCALIITKIFSYFIYFMYMSISGRGSETLINSTLGIEKEDIITQPLNIPQQKKTMTAHSNNTQIFKNMNVNNEAFAFNLYNMVVLFNSKASYRITQIYFYITVSIQMLQIFKSIHLYVHDNSSLLNNSNIKRINVLILIFSIAQIFLCWILTPTFS